MKTGDKGAEENSVPPAESERAAEGARGRRKNERDLAGYFVDRLNKSIKAHWSTLIELLK